MLAHTHTHRGRELYVDILFFSTPAPGYFNDDDTPDFMLQQNFGAWPKYSWTEVRMLDNYITIYNTT